MDLIERVRYKAALIVSGCWHGISREKLYDELGWESLSDRGWARRLTIFYKINNGLRRLTCPTISQYITEQHLTSVIGLKVSIILSGMKIVSFRILSRHHGKI